MYYIKQTRNITEFINNLIYLYFNHENDKIKEILKIDENKEYLNNVKFNKYDKNNGMVFYNSDNPNIDVRIYVDEETKYILKSLIMITSNLIDEKLYVDLIIDKWLKSNITGLLKHDNIPNIGKESYIKLIVGKKSWDNLLKACNNKNILSKIGFKMSLINYINEIYCNIDEFKQ